LLFFSENLKIKFKINLDWDKFKNIYKNTFYYSYIAVCNREISISMNVVLEADAVLDIHQYWIYISIGYTSVLDIHQYWIHNIYFCISQSSNLNMVHLLYALLYLVVEILDITGNM